MRFKKLLIAITCSFILLVAIYIAVGVAAPVKLLAGACGGGYKTFLMETYKSDMHSAMKNETGRSFTDSEVAQIKRNMDFDGRKINCDIITTSGEKLLLQGTLKWYWDEHLVWEVKTIDKL